MRELGEHGEVHAQERFGQAAPADAGNNSNSKIDNSALRRRGFNKQTVAVFGQPSAAAAGTNVSPS